MLGDAETVQASPPLVKRRIGPSLSQRPRLRAPKQMVIVAKRTVIGLRRNVVERWPVITASQKIGEPAKMIASDVKTMIWCHQDHGKGTNTIVDATKTMVKIGYPGNPLKPNRLTSLKDDGQ